MCSIALCNIIPAIFLIHECVALNGVITTLFIILYIVYVGDEFSVTASAIYSGDKITVTYDTSAGAVCTCQLDSGAPVPCKNYLCM